MKKKFRMLFRFLMSILVTFAVIYLLVFSGGWKLLESGDIVLIEVAVSVVVGTIVFIICENWRDHECKIKSLQEQIEKLEEKIDKINNLNDVR